MDALNLSVLLSIIAGITVMTNIIVQVLKRSLGTRSRPIFWHLSSPRR